MIRYIFCEKCKDRMSNVHQEDIDNGWRDRRVRIERSKTPVNHHIEIVAGPERQIIPVPILVCDGCNDQIETGTPAIAVTMWQSPDDEPENWEEEFTCQQ